MRYTASEKLETIRLVEGSYLPTKRTLDKLGIPRTTFYRWYDSYLAGGPEALEDQAPICSKTSDDGQIPKVRSKRHREFFVDRVDVFQHLIRQADVGGAQHGLQLRG